MIYQDDRLKKREYKSIFDESKMIDEYNEKISLALGNHRDENNIFAKKLLEFEKDRIVRKALVDILQIKQDVYNITGVKL